MSADVRAMHPATMRHTPAAPLPATPDPPRGACVTNRAERETDAGGVEVAQPAPTCTIEVRQAYAAVRSFVGGLVWQ